MEESRTVRLIRGAFNVARAAFYSLAFVGVLAGMYLDFSGSDHADPASGKTFVIEFGKGGEHQVYVWPWAGRVFFILAFSTFAAGILFWVLNTIVHRVDRT